MKSFFKKLINKFMNADIIRKPLRTVKVYQHVESVHREIWGASPINLKQNTVIFLNVYKYIFKHDPVIKFNIIQNDLINHSAFYDCEYSNNNYIKTIAENEHFKAEVWLKENIDKLKNNALNGLHSEKN